MNLTNNETPIYSSESGRFVPPHEIYTYQDLKGVVSESCISGSVSIRDGEVTDLSPVNCIDGTLGLSDCRIESLSPVETIMGDIWCSFHNRRPVLRSLGSLRKVDGDASFRYTPLSDLGNLEYVGGNLSLRDTRIDNLGRLSYIGGNLYLPNRLKGRLNFENLIVKGRIVYWNDATKLPFSDLSQEGESILTKSDIPVPFWQNTIIYPFEEVQFSSVEVQCFYQYFKQQFSKGILLDTENNTNYYFLLMFDLKKEIRSPKVLAKKYSLLSKGYPKVRSYCKDILLETYKERHMYQEAWNLIKKRDYLSLQTVYEYADYLGDSIFDGEVAVKICGSSCLTSFGRKNLHSILPFFSHRLERYEQEHGCRFYNVFYDPGKLYREINGHYDAEYYRQFYKLNEESFDFYDSIDNDDYHKAHPDKEKLVVDHAALEQLRVLIIECEDMYRESIGAPKIGEGWISETALFYKIKDHYNSYRVIQHGRPSWLGRQHLDVYFKDLNIGVEYQGVQHYKPVDYFGGEDGFASNIERDERKRLLCEKNDCPLIYVDEGYDFKDVVSSIDLAITQKNLSLKPR